MQGKWARNTSKYGTGEIYKIGKIQVGSYFNATVSRGSPTVYRANVELPGIRMKAETTDFDNAEAAKIRVEKVVATWFNWLNTTE